MKKIKIFHGTYMRDLEASMNEYFADGEHDINDYELQYQVNGHVYTCMVIYRGGHDTLETDEIAVGFPESYTVCPVMALRDKEKG